MNLLPLSKLDEHHVANKMLTRQRLCNIIIKFDQSEEMGLRSNQWVGDRINCHYLKKF